MNEADVKRLEDMTQYSRDAIAFLEGHDRADLDTDLILARAVIYSVGIVGEAASQISQSTRDANPQVPWRSAVAMRNFLFHAYFGVDNNILWQTVHESLPSLILELEKILPPSDSEG